MLTDTMPNDLSAFPSVTLTDGRVTMLVCLPDAERGLYRGSRFDWSGMILRAEHAGHIYYGLPSPPGDRDPSHRHSGPAEEFVERGQTSYADAQPGQPFIKVGVGLLRRESQDDYRSLREYSFIEPGQWQVESGPDWIEFRQELADPYERSYRYIKRVELTAEPAGFIIHHHLANIGRKTLQLDHYNHNFTMIDDRPIWPDCRMLLPFSPPQPQTVYDGPTGTIPYATFAEGQVRFFRPLDTYILADLEGLRNTAADNDVTFVNDATGGGIALRGDLPVTIMRFYATNRTISAEPFVAIRLEPGQEQSWQIAYRFLSKD